MSENAQAAQNPAADSSWKSDFDALNGIQYILWSLNQCCPEAGWSPENIDSDVQTMSDFCQVIGGMTPLTGPFTSLNPSDAAKLIASLAKSLSDQQGSNYIISACKDIDPSSAS